MGNSRQWKSGPMTWILFGTWIVFTAQIADEAHSTRAPLKVRACFVFSGHCWSSRGGLRGGMYLGAQVVRCSQSHSGLERHENQHRGGVHIPRPLAARPLAVGLASASAVLMKGERGGLFQYFQRRDPVCTWDLVSVCVYVLVVSRAPISRCFKLQLERKPPL